jgi:D-alanine-D-alanine ligase-like ATP-grasp enzyme
MDLTIACVRDEISSFQLSRDKFLARSVDWREVSTKTLSDDWPVHHLTNEFKQRVLACMSDMGLHYGRIDMLYGNGEYHFIEVNSNGEWGWLDADC